jgi:hypothetical protein
LLIATVNDEKDQTAIITLRKQFEEQAKSEVELERKKYNLQAAWEGIASKHNEVQDSVYPAY